MANSSKKTSSLDFVEKSLLLSKTIHALSRAAADKESTCERLETAVDAYIEKEKKLLVNQLPHCDEKHEACSCGGGKSAESLVDVIVLIDASGSMSVAAKAVSDAAVEAVAAAAKDCPSNLRMTWLTVDGSKTGANPAGDLGDITTILSGTPFTQTHQQYLVSIGATGPFKQDEAQPAGDSTYPGEEGADAISDLCNFFDWRKGACKSIFYISDTALDGYSAFYDAAASNATNAAVANGVVLFAHIITPITGTQTGPNVEAAYDHLTIPTGGSAYHGVVDVAQYKMLLKNAICKACGSECKEAKLPVMEPCVSISWGSSDCDCFETDDVETAIISVCNCYSNISFNNVHISFIYITMADGSPVPNLPDGTPSVRATPIGPICFGDIGPCVEGGTNCVSREFVIRTRGAKSGDYRINVGGICYDIVIHKLMNECFKLTLCKD